LNEKKNLIETLKMNESANNYQIYTNQERITNMSREIEKLRGEN